MSTETPLQQMKRLYGSKQELVDKIAKLARKSDGEGEEEDVDDVKARLLTASNAKLLRLAEVTEVVKNKYGSRDKLVDSLAETMNRAKDNDYVSKLRTKSQTVLLDMMRGAQKRVRRN